MALPTLQFFENFADMLPFFLHFFGDGILLFGAVGQVQAATGMLAIL